MRSVTHRVQDHMHLGLWSCQRHVVVRLGPVLLHRQYLANAAKIEGGIGHCCDIPLAWSQALVTSVIGAPG